MKKYYLIILVSILLISGLVAYTIKPKWSIDTTKDIDSKINNSQSTINRNKPDTELTYKRDLNKDGVEETIKVIFETKKYRIIITSASEQYVYEGHDLSDIVANVKFADFDTKDKYIEFYINNKGQNYDPRSTIYRFDNDGIKKICDTVGYIKEYDGEGQIYTDFSKTADKFGVLLSYYDIDKGKAVFVSKNKLVDRKLQYDNSLILFNDLTDKNGCCKSCIDDNLGKKEVEKLIATYNKNNIIKICEPNEILTIVDVDNTYNGRFKEGNSKNIRIKVKTEDGKVGWLNWLNDGD